MKKVISVLLAALMLMSCFGVVSFAATNTFENMCICLDHLRNQPCSCCVLCPNPDIDKWQACYRDTCETDENGNLVNGIFCCTDCKGIAPCACLCECCNNGNENIEDDDALLDNVITDQNKETFVDTFQEILKKISDFFDMFFDTIFEFLKIDSVIGKGENPEA